MRTLPQDANSLRDVLAAKLTDAGLRVAARHRVDGCSVDHDLGLWKALGEVVGRGRSSNDSLVAEVTEAAYRVALAHGLRDNFVDVQLDLWEVLCLAVHRSQAAAQLFGSSRPGDNVLDCGCPAEHPSNRVAPSVLIP